MTTRDTSTDDAGTRTYRAVLASIPDGDLEDLGILTGAQAERIFGLDRYELARACASDGVCEFESDDGGKLVTLVPEGTP